MDEAGIPSTEQLLADIAWIRRLARALVRDDATADDVVQETWLAHVNVLSVRTSDAPPASIGLGLTPRVLPLTVEGVAPNGPAATAGVRAGDHVVAIDGAPLDGVLPAGAAALIGNHRPGTTITLAIERAGATQNIKLVVPAR